MSESQYYLEISEYRFCVLLTVQHCLIYRDVTFKTNNADWRIPPVGCNRNLSLGKEALLTILMAIDLPSPVHVNIECWVVGLGRSMSFSRSNVESLEYLGLQKQPYFSGIFSGIKVDCLWAPIIEPCLLERSLKQQPARHGHLTWLAFHEL